VIDQADLDWDKVGGMMPAIVQHARSGQVLMFAHMTREALAKTIATGLVTFHSRSRGRLWTKGETSGHHLRLVDIRADCDRDCLLVLADPVGPTCHLGWVSCFGEEPVHRMGFLDQLEAIVRARRDGDDVGSHTARLFAAGPARIAQKVGEEGVETALAGALGTDGLTDEAADLVYHLIVLLAVRGLDLDQVVQVLAARHDRKRGRGA
jgi:phosphoribosyl-ATP pyrophosphohydrolase/phosphoribosyl-AMP cyclohydrolase